MFSMLYIFFLWRMDWSNGYVSMKQSFVANQELSSDPAPLSFTENFTFSFQLLAFSF